MTLNTFFSVVNIIGGGPMLSFANHDNLPFDDEYDIHMSYEN